MADSDYLLALKLSEEWNFDVISKEKEKKTENLSVVDPSWELIDPVPDIRELFVEFNAAYFDGMLAGVEVKWSARMTLCAGLCCYEGRGGLCSIKLSTPLLKLRPRKDLVETLLHEMIHALLFVTDNNKDHDGHGKEFHKHMYRINKQAGCNITVYHSFHDEVNSYRQHWWRCDGPCVKWRPYYGIVRRAMNRAPSECDPWWNDHKRRCGGSYTKIKEPEDYGKKKTKEKELNKPTESKRDTIGSREITSFFNKTPKPEPSKVSSKGGVKWKKPGTSSTSTITVKGSKTKANVNNTKNSETDGAQDKEINSKIHGFGASGADEQIYKASGGNASSNIHGFKMSARKNEERKLNTFQGKGVSLGGSCDTNTSKAVVPNNARNLSTVAMKRDLFLKRLENSSHAKRVKLDDEKSDRPNDDCRSDSRERFVNEHFCDNSAYKNSPICLDDSLSDEDKYVECPACPKLVRENELNEHLDMCLS